MKPLIYIPVIVGIILTIAGLILKIFPPKKINWIYGYRTSTSMKNQDTWDTANRYSAKLMTICGILLIIIGFVSFFLPALGKIEHWIYLGVIVISIGLIIILTERHLNKFFDKDGKKKT